MTSTKQLIGWAGAAVAVGSFMASSARANVYGYYADQQHMEWGITNMPDFDQGRMSASGIIGLANSGSVHCVPTSSMNLFAYAARHGYSTLAPGVHNWQDGTLDTYNIATFNIALLGLGMNTAPPGGTGNTGWFNGTRSWLPEHQFDVWHQVAFNNYPVNSREIARLGLVGGLVNFCYGRWEHDGYTLTERTSGHCVTPTNVEVDGQLLSSTLKYRDPATGGSSFSQSSFSTATAEMTDLFWSKDGNSYLMSTFDVGNTLSSAKYNIIDTLHVIFPKQGLTNWPNGYFTLSTPFHFGSSFTDEIQYEAPGPIQSLELAPNRLCIALITDDGGRVKQLFKVDPLVGESVEVARLTDPKGMAFCRRGYLNVVDGSAIKQFDLSNDEEPLVAMAFLPGGVLGDDIVYDDATDEIVVVSRDPNEVHRYPFDFSDDPTTESIPYVGPIVASQMAARINPVDGTLFIGYRDAGEIVQMRRNPSNGRLERGVGYGGPDADPISNFEFDDRGHLFVTRDGVVREYMFQEDGSTEEVEGIFTGMRAGSSFHLTRSRTNFDPASQSDPGWDIATPLDELRIVEEVVDCTGDYTGDGIADISDVLAFLSDWFEGNRRANIDDLGGVDISDLLFFLGGWFAGCPSA